MIVGRVEFLPTVPDPDLHLMAGRIQFSAAIETINLWQSKWHRPRVSPNLAHNRDGDAVKYCYKQHMLHEQISEPFSMASHTNQ
jgi:hypothetical protein